MLARARESCSASPDAVVDQATDDKALSRSEFDVGFHSAGREGGNEEARDGHGVRDVDRGNLGLHVHLDGAVLGDHWIEGEPDTELAELNCDRARITAALQDRHRKLTANQEARFLAVGRNQIRFGHDLQYALGSARL